MKKTIIFVLVLLIAVSFVSLAEGSKETETQEDQKTALSDKHGGEIVLMSGKIPTLNPFNGHWNVGFVTNNIFCSLTRLDSNNKVAPYLAESWDISDDGLTYTFNLAEDATFHDGEPITSEDVVFSIGIAKKHNRFGIGMFGPVQTMETPDEHTVIVRLSKPHGPIMVGMTSARQLPILPKHVYGSGDFADLPAHTAPTVGSGPFVFKEWSVDEYIILERNDNHFYKDTPYLDRIIFKVVTDKTAMRAGLKRNEFDLAAVAMAMRYRDIDSFAEMPNLALTEMKTPNGGGAYLEFNNRIEPLNNKKVRQAISHAIDRNYIANVLHGGYTKASVGPFPYTNLFFYEDLEGREYDVDEANKLLDEAGYPRKGDDNIRFELGVLYIAPPHEPDRQIVIAEYMTEALKDVGIKVIQEPMPGAAAWSQRMADWDYDTSIILAGDKVDPAVGIGRLYRTDNIKHQAYTNTSGYSNPEVDELFKRGAMEPNFEKRKAIYAEVQELLVEEMPMNWLVDAVDFMIHHKDLWFHPYGYSTTADEVYWKTPQD